MAEPLKNSYTENFVDELLNCWKNVLPELDTQKFKTFTFSDGWENLELKERMSRLSDAMGLILPQDFGKAAPIVKKMITVLANKGLPVSGFEFMFIPEYVAKKGLHHFDLSLDALKHITQFVSCEFAIRPFILKDEAKSMEFMLNCSLNKHQNVRRFSSEGCRARLPWAMALPRFKKDASLILPILKNLKNDPSLFVRKSVANNLNDISKDHPELALQLAYKWFGKDENTNWIVKHGMRTLLKAGNSDAMKLFGYADAEQLKLIHFKLLTSTVEYGKEAVFEFSVQNNSNKAEKIRLEYAVYFLKNNKLQTKKVFKISERTVEKQQQLDFIKHHPLKPISTRKYYPGEHGIALIINGIEFEKQSFLLNMESINRSSQI